jgi:hypothetical protein
MLPRVGNGDISLDDFQDWLLPFITKFPARGETNYAGDYNILSEFDVAFLEMADGLAEEADIRNLANAYVTAWGTWWIWAEPTELARLCGK